MIDVKKQYPAIMPNGEIKSGLIKFWAEDETGKRYNIKQVETGVEYYEAIDVYPSRYTYEVVEETNEDVDKGDEEDVV